MLSWKLTKISLLISYKGYWIKYNASTVKVGVDKLKNKEKTCNSFIGDIFFIKVFKNLLDKKI